MEAQEMTLFWIDDQLDEFIGDVWPALQSELRNSSLRLEGTGPPQAKTVEDAGQQLLFEQREVYGFRARRAAVETHHRERLAEIDTFERGSDPKPPQPLGVLFVLPPEVQNAS